MARNRTLDRKAARWPCRAEEMSSIYEGHWSGHLKEVINEEEDSTVSLKMSPQFRPIISFTGQHCCWYRHFIERMKGVRQRDRKRETYLYFISKFKIHLSICQSIYLSIHDFTESTKMLYCRRHHTHNTFDSSKQNKQNSFPLTLSPVRNTKRYKFK